MSARKSVMQILDPFLSCTHFFFFCGLIAQFPLSMLIFLKIIYGLSDCILWWIFTFYFPLSSFDFYFISFYCIVLYFIGFHLIWFNLVSLSFISLYFVIISFVLMYFILLSVVEKHVKKLYSMWACYLPTCCIFQGFFDLWASLEELWQV